MIFLRYWRVSFFVAQRVGVSFLIGFICVICWTINIKNSFAYPLDKAYFFLHNAPFPTWNSAFYLSKGRVQKRVARGGFLLFRTASRGVFYAPTPSYFLSNSLQKSSVPLFYRNYRQRIAIKLSVPLWLRFSRVKVAAFCE